MVVVDDEPLDDGQVLSVPAEEHVVVAGAGDGGHFLCAPDIVDHLVQAQDFRRGHQVAVALEVVVQAIGAEVKVISLGELAAGEENLLRLGPLGVHGDVPGHGVKDFQKFGRVPAHALESDFRHNHLPVGGGDADQLQLVPDVQQLEKPPVVAFDLPGFPFVQEENIFVHRIVGLQRIPQPGHGFHQEVAPVVHQISAVHHFFVPVHRVFHGIVPHNPVFNAGQGDIVPLLVHHTAPTEQNSLVGDFPQGQNGGVVSPPDLQVFSAGERGVIHSSQPLGFFGPEIAILQMVHKSTSCFRFSEAAVFGFTSPNIP